ncbi:hypothetical protein IGB42_03107 [Andreprevotia sp. IGB-42]|uniref:PilW family protein n=1 Tax=Andreprevotia sp. IGB-42 TaxID=2497473 RepID=UPI00135B8BED|nr:PilW family protein [Andreprevotia sp. IGB-42]KAF0812439.1 hypothetical protein IGB42_03107 [Andreprevotia sp. IGB-42]
MSQSLHNRGFTLIELAVGLTLSMILAFAVGNIYLQTKSTFRTQTAQTRLGEDGRYIMSLFQRMGVQSGYRSWGATNNAVPLATAFTAASPFAAGQTLVESSDELYVRFYGEADGNIIRCDNNSTADTDYPSVKDPNTLNSYKIYLDTSTATIKCAKTDGTNSQIQVSGVVDFNLTYGVDADSVPDGVAETHVAAGSVSNWNNVYVMRMCIVLKSADDNMAPKIKDAAGTLIHPTYLDCSYPNQGKQTATDYRLYRTFVTTVFLRNRYD